jgi:hypothetical protein
MSTPSSNPSKSADLRPPSPATAVDSGVSASLQQLKVTGASAKLALTTANAPIGESLRSRGGVFNHDVDFLSGLADLEDGDVVSTGPKKDSFVKISKSGRQSSTVGTFVKEIKKQKRTPVPDTLPILKDIDFFVSPMGGSMKSETESVFSFTSSRKELPLFYTRAEGQDTCGGIIGGNSLIFCTKDKDLCKVYQRGGAHFHHRVDVKSHFAYIRKTGDQAWTNTAISDALLKNLSIQNGTLPEQGTNNEWTTVFNAAKALDANSADARAVDRTLVHQKGGVKISELKTPRKNLGKDELLQDELVKPLTEDQFKTKVSMFIPKSVVSHWETLNLPPSLIQQLKDTSTFLLDLSSEVDDLQVKIKGCAEGIDVGEDFLNISASLNGLKERIGDCGIHSYPDLASGLAHLSEEVSTLIKRVSDLDWGSRAPEDILKHVRLIEEQTDRWAGVWGSGLAQATVNLSDLDERFETFKTGFSESSSMLKGLREDVSNNSRRLNDVEFDDRNHEATFTELRQTIVDLRQDMEDLRNQIMNSKQSPEKFSFGEQHDGLTSDSVSFGRFHFEHGEKSILLWLKDKMTRPRPGVFIDLNTIFEFMPTGAYVEKGTTLGNLHSGNKIGFTNAADATVATSFENILPGLFARIRSTTAGITSTGGNEYDLSCYSELPGIPTYADWDAGDTTTGRKHFIIRNLKNTKYLIDNWIRSEIQGEPQLLAFELLQASVYMAQELVQFVSMVYLDLKTSGRFDGDQAWNLACKFVKRIFTELGDARVVARDAIHCDDLWFSTAKILYGILRAHVVMKEYMRLNIHDHPSISSEMVKFVCYAQPASDTSDLISKLNAVEEQVKKSVSMTSKHESRIKRFENWKDEASKQLKKGN